MSVDAKKVFDKVQHSFMIKTLTKVGLEEVYLKVFLLKSGTRQGCPFSLFSTAIPQKLIQHCKSTVLQ